MLLRRQQGWVAWSVSGIAKNLGYVPTQSEGRPMTLLTEAAIQDLYRELDDGLQTTNEDRDAALQLKASLHFEVGWSDYFLGEQFANLLLV
jgi:hypothetical protein